MKKNSITGILALTAIMLVLLYFRFPDFFQSPNSKVVEPWGDGYKAYMAIVNHARYDSTYAHFEGMNYPYGDHAVPGATQPIVSNSIRFISRHFFDITGYTIGIVHWAMILGLLFCAVFCFLIFKRLGLPTVYSGFVAIGLAFLNPQMERMGSHYGLAHPEVIPVVFYFLLRFEQSRQLKWSFAVALAVWAFSLIHFYYFAILAFTIGIYFCFTTLRDKAFSIKVILHNFKHFSIQLLLPLLFFIYWIYWNDPVQDRCSEPWGYLYYHAEIEGIFTSSAQPYFHGWGLKQWAVENKTYLGAVAILTGALLMLVFLKKIFLKAPVSTKSENDFWLNNLFLTSLVVLLFSFGLPFTIPGWEYLLEYVKPIEQFRSVGRFAWVSYYGFNLVAFYWLYQKAGRQKAWLILPVALLLFEGWNHTRSYNLKLDAVDEFEAGKTFNDIKSLHISDYQAVIPVPYYNIGSGNFWIDVKGFVGQKSQTLSMQTGIPLTAAMLTRSSLSQTFNQLELVAEPYRSPKLLKDLKDDRPFLLVWDATRAREFSPKYDHLKAGLEMVYENYPLQLFRLPLETFDQRIEARRQSILLQFGSGDLRPLPRNGLLQDSTVTRTELFSKDTISFCSYHDWNDLAAEKSYKGQGGYEGQFGDQKDVLEEAVPPGKYTLSFWMFLQPDLYARTEIILEEYHTESGAVIKKEVKPVHHHVAVIGEDGWCLVEMPMQVTTENSRFKIKLQHEKRRFAQKPVYLDELLIRPEGKNVLFRKDHWYVENDRWFEE